MANVEGFWSYVHADDEADGERISRLARDVAAQFEMLTGEPLSLFLDKDAIVWGDNWREKVDSTLSSVAFFIPVMTPRYFRSAECRREFQYFGRQATRIGIKELILPLLYVDVPALHDDSATDDLVVLARTFQWENWRDLRFADASSEAYRRGVAKLAERLVEANRLAEKRDVAITALERTGSRNEEDQSPGVLDRLVQAEEALPAWTDTLDAIAAEITTIGELMHQASADIKRGDQQAAGFAARLLVARSVAKKLSEPTDRIRLHGNTFVSQLHDVDAGIRIIIEQAPTAALESAEAKQGICVFFASIRKMSESAQTGLGSVQEMVEAIAPVERMSRDLRPVLRRLREGLTLLLEAREVIDEWVQLIAASDVDCADNDAPDAHTIVA